MPEAKITAELDPTGAVRYTIPQEIMERNQPEIIYSTFIDEDTGSVVYVLELVLEEKGDDNADQEAHVPAVQ